MIEATLIARKEGRWPGFDADTLELRIVQDEDPPSPREWDNLGTMVCWHRRYRLGDDHDYSTPEDFSAVIKEPGVLALPLYLMDHSGITLRTIPFEGMYGRWDSMQVGFIYITRERILKEMCYTSRKKRNPDLKPIRRISRKLLERAKKMLIEEVAVYNAYLQGNTWGFQLFKGGEEIDSCWGFYGTDWKANGLADHLGRKYSFLIELLGEVDNA